MSIVDTDTITHKIIGCAYQVGNILGAGFLESVYENALAHEIRKAGLIVEPQRELSVYYDEVLVGSFKTDLVVENHVVVELKACINFNRNDHLAQCLNYLKATGLSLCLLINFGQSVDVKRISL